LIEPTETAKSIEPAEPIELPECPVLWSERDPSARAMAEALSAVYFLAWEMYNLLRAVS